MDPKMGEFVPVARISEVQSGKPKSLMVNGHRLLIVVVAGKYYAADNHCPHYGSVDLHDGTLEGTVLTCPRHVAKFDLTDGSVIRWPDWMSVKADSSRLFTSPVRLATHSVKVDGDMIFVEL